MSDDPSVQFGNLLQTAQRMQQEVARVQERLAAQVVEGTAGGGMVTARANGRQQLLSLTIEPSIIDKEEREMLQDLVVAAVNQALAKAHELSQQEMASITGGLALNIPGLS
ncbi:MAG: YbaB/EbfC family nucleoid-associated protein [Deltaproteobacteria bacterium]|nr:YbaB/EbfC family nucleoid-associated protein [Deltaproteobacteria bacterium]